MAHDAADARSVDYVCFTRAYDILLFQINFDYCLKEILARQRIRVWKGRS